MTEDAPGPGAATDASTQAWRAQVAYHQDRAKQEKVLARRSRSEAGRAAHLVLSERHQQLAASAELVTDMPDAELPQSSSLHHTGWLMRESYGDVIPEAKA
ncbi:hypothetical protein VH567_04500 [Sphingomonas sp. 4RDLI-65]|uniref:hypothetical protein n=1 Tax=Sphingomonas sp. 4RDLI-65 TaxID=3111641 RepID=UPI003C1A6A44